MPCFIKTPIQGRLDYIGVVTDRPNDLKSAPLEAVELSLDGIKGESHGGRTRPACVRVSMLYAKGTEIANARQLSLMSREELDAMAQDAQIDENRYEWWGASLGFSGIPEFSALPPSSRLQFPSGASIRVDVENDPCADSARVVAEGSGGDAPLILRSAKHRRGVVGSVEREGAIKRGDSVQLFIPNARPYAHAGR